MKNQNFINRIGYIFQNRYLNVLEKIQFRMPYVNIIRLDIKRRN